MTTSHISVLVKQNIARPGVRYLLVGGSVYVLELIVITIAQKLGYSAVTAVAASFIVGVIVSFLLQKIVTFKDRRTHHKVIASQIIAVALLVVFNFSFSVEATRLLHAHLPAVIIRTLALLVTTIWNFYLYRTRIFKAPVEVVG